MADSGAAPTRDLAIEVLQILSQKSSAQSKDAFPDVPSQELKGALDRLSSRSMITYKTIEKEEILLEPEGEEIVEHGSHEARVYEALKRAMDGLTVADLEKAIGDKKITKLGQGKAFREKWISKSEDGKLTASASSIEDVTRNTLRQIRETRTGEAKTISDLKRRKMVRPNKIVSFEIAKGDKFALEIEKEETDLTAEMLATGSWKTVKFKPYNFDAMGLNPQAGNLHPLNKVKSEFRQIFVEMGFEEMPTDNFVETSFWNFDALFVPQQHPARDLQDTFYIADPRYGDKPRPIVPGQDTEKYWQDIKEVHQGGKKPLGDPEGKFGSIGYRYPWDEKEPLRLVLRTHTTASSAAMLYKLAATKGPDGKPLPAKYFSIDRVFRNETVDATHLAEFHQVEGVTADYGLSLGGLMGFMEVFFAKMGITDLKFKPAYNPYTEPSLEIFSFHKGLNKLVEIGNSGMFRPEMLQPMGFPEDMRVFGWGLSLERPTMIKYGISNIRELLGHKVDLNFIKNSPAVRLDK